MIDWYFLHDRPWISPWMKSISNELDIIIHLIASQLSDHCDIISNRLWHHHQNENRASETRGWCEKIVIFIVICGSLRRVRNKIMYVLSWRTVSALTSLYCYFGIYFPRCFMQIIKKHIPFYKAFSGVCHTCNTVEYKAWMSYCNRKSYIPLFIPLKFDLKIEMASLTRELF